MTVWSIKNGDKPLPFVTPATATTTLDSFALHSPSYIRFTGTITDLYILYSVSERVYFNGFDESHVMDLVKGSDKKQYPAPTSSRLHCFEGVKAATSLDVHTTLPSIDNDDKVVNKYSVGLYDTCVNYCQEKTDDDDDDP